jgi:hypothetical protein
VKPAAVADLTIDEAIRTPQFHLLGFSFFALATGNPYIFMYMYAHYYFQVNFTITYIYRRYWYVISREAHDE